MARGRMLNKKISKSIQFNGLPDDTCRLLATWIIAHLDKNGVYTAEPVLVKAEVLPWRSDVSYEQVEYYLEAMEKNGLIVRFKACGQLWQYWPGFVKNQIGLRQDREETDCPEPPAFEPDPAPQTPPEPPRQAPAPLPTINEDIAGSEPDTSRNDAGMMPDKIPPNTTTTTREEKGKLTTTTREGEGAREFTDEDLSVVCRCYEQEIGLLSPSVADSIKDALATYPAEWITDATKTAALANNRKFTYILGILKNWQAKGRGTGPPGARADPENGRKKPVVVDRSTGQELSP